MAAALAVDGIVSHRSAAELWGLIQPAGYVEVSVPPGPTATVRPPAIVHRIKDLRPGLAVERDGLRVTDPVRTVIDLGLVMPWWLVHRAIAKGISTKALHGQRGADAPRRARSSRPQRHRDRAGDPRRQRCSSLGKEESELEKRFTALSQTATASPTLTLQHEVWDAGRFVGRVDARYPELKLAIEVDGFEHHSTPEAFQRDRTRQNELVALGWTVLRFTWHDVVHRPAQVAQTIRAGDRTARPPPDPRRLCSDFVRIASASRAQTLGG